MNGLHILISWSLGTRLLMDNASTARVLNYSSRRLQDGDTKWQTHAGNVCPTKLYKQGRAGGHGLVRNTGIYIYIYRCT